MPEPMSEERLAEIEAALGFEHPDGTCAVDEYVPELIAEVRRLRERDHAQEMLADVLANPGKYPEVERRVREIMGFSATDVGDSKYAVTLTNSLSVSGNTTLG